MKKFLFFILMFMAIFFNGFTQRSNITLTFNAVYFNSSAYTRLDSIIVTNISKGADTVLYYPDTLLVLDYGVGIPGNKNHDPEFRIIQNYPNPVTDLTIIGIFIPAEDHVNVTITDIKGRELIASEIILKRGHHSFIYIPGKNYLSFFTATWRGYKQVIKIIQVGSGNDKECKLVYSGYSGTVMNLKSQKTIMGFTFDPGDSLRYIGYALTPAGISGSDVKGDVPLANETITFEILEGLPCPGLSLVTFEGKHYKTVQIGTQCWFKENLDAGTFINSSQSQTNNAIKEKYCYQNLKSNCDIYGGIYQWDEAMQYATISGVQGLCPDGWHIPNDGEYTTLSSYLGGVLIAGGKMKETGLTHWASPNTGASNSSGFTARGAGYWDFGLLMFYELKVSASFWTSNQDNTYPTAAWCRYIYNYQQNLVAAYYLKTNAWSVRCIKN